jgi:hypothetical protein
MGKSLRTLLHLLLIAAVLVGLTYWVNDAPLTREILLVRVGSVLAVIGLVAILFWAEGRKDLVPNKLAQISGQYLERQGLCLALGMTVKGNICWLQIYFQNRFANACQGRVVVKPARWRSFRNVPLETVDVRFGCDGGAFGVCNVPWPIDEKLQGRITSVEVIADVEYPIGRGKKLRYREGMPIGPASGVMAALDSMSRLSEPVVSLELPRDVNTQLPPGLTGNSAILWRPDLPTGGFPVQLRNQRAPAAEQSVTEPS